MSFWICKSWDAGHTFSFLLPVHQKFLSFFLNMDPSTCWRGHYPYIYLFIYLCSEVHVQNVQVCYIVIHVPWWFAAPINPSSTLGISPNAILSLALHSLTGPGMWYCLPCVHVFSLFSSHLWVRTCGVWFSVPVLVCWRWWLSASSTSLQRTWPHSFLWLHGIPWYTYTTFLFPVYLSSLGIWISSRSLLL